MKKLFALVLTLCLLLTGCGQQAGETQSVAAEETVQTYGSTDPQLAINTIFKDMPIREIYAGDEDALKNLFLLDTSLLEEYYVRYTSGRYGIADAFILKPKADQTAKVKEQLEQVKLMRMRDAEHYDVNDAAEITRNGLVFEQGEYVILLMVPDMEAARATIDYYILKN